MHYKMYIIYEVVVTTKDTHLSIYNYEFECLMNVKETKKVTCAVAEVKVLQHYNLLSLESAQLKQVKDQVKTESSSHTLMS